MHTIAYRNVLTRFVSRARKRRAQSQMDVGFLGRRKSRPVTSASSTRTQVARFLFLVAARLVNRPYLSANLTASLEGSVGFTLFGAGKVAGGTTPTLTQECTGRLVTTGIQLSNDGTTSTDVIPLEHESHYDATHPSPTDFPGLGTLATLMRDACFEVYGDDFCLGHSLQSTRWM